MTEDEYQQIRLLTVQQAAQYLGKDLRNFKRSQFWKMYSKPRALHAFIDDDTHKVRDEMLIDIRLEAVQKKRQAYINSK